ncbi:MAG: hypothetical protein Hyperionvirus34_8 [Hyperionvirus sp.]|uniref:Uncharacterized protein n=1 Tax=Hyperionvirus sp. TaxID=2487770 RepID=A0A3G5ADJ1_9VIRU|nr:MAG: hypothetical protein Hyperionvirus34_8 [Hyperionvirus sp.]
MEETFRIVDGLNQAYNQCNNEIYKQILKSDLKNVKVSPKRPMVPNFRIWFEGTRVGLSISNACTTDYYEVGFLMSETDIVDEKKDPYFDNLVERVCLFGKYNKFRYFNKVEELMGEIVHMQKFGEHVAEFGIRTAISMFKPIEN